MNYNNFFKDALSGLKAEGRYRVFANLERIVGKFPKALYHPGNGDAPREITVWCSNDYLGMGQHPKVLAAMQARAAVRAVPEIFPAPTIFMSRLSRSSPICMARKPHF